MEHIPYSTEVIIQWIFVGIIIFTALIIILRRITKRVERLKKGQSLCGNCPDSVNCQLLKSKNISNCSKINEL